MPTDVFGETGLIRADAWQPRADRGVVVAVSRDSPSLVGVGDTILFSPRAGADYTIEGRPYTLLNPAEIAMVLT